MCAPDPPAAPDYAASAKEQGAANIEAARVQGKLNNPNVINPYGTQTVQFGTFDQPAFEKAQQDYYKKLDEWYSLGGPNAQQVTGSQMVWDQGANDGSGDYVPQDVYGPIARPVAPREADYGSQLDQPTVTQTFSPEQQAIFEAGNRAKILLSNLAEKGAGQAGDVLGQSFTLSGVPQAGRADITTGAPALRGTEFTAGLAALPGSDLNALAPELASRDFTAGAPTLRGTEFTAGASPLPQDAAATRNAAYNAIMSRVTEDTLRQRDDLHSTLIAAGLRPGSRAYDDQMALLERKYTDAQQQAILSANQQAQQDFQQAMALREQTVGEQAQMFGASQTARQQAIAEQQAQFAASQAAREQMVGEQQRELAAAQALRQQAVAEQQGMFGAAQAARQQTVAEQQAQQQAMDTLRRQYIAEQMMLRQMPLNEVTALMSGSQVSNPFAIPGYAQNAQVAPAPIFQGAQAQWNAASDIYNVEAQQAAALQQGLFDLAGSGLMAVGMKK